MLKYLLYFLLYASVQVKSTNAECINGICKSSSCIDNNLSFDQYNCPSTRCIGLTSRGCKLLNNQCLGSAHCLGLTQDNQTCLSNGKSVNYKVCVKGGTSQNTSTSTTDNCNCPDPPNENTGLCPVNKISLRINAEGIQETYIQCIDPPNYDVMTRVMAFSWCWSYKCFPLSFEKRNIFAETYPTSIYNIPRIPRLAIGNIDFYKPVDRGVNVSIVYRNSIFEIFQYNISANITTSNHTFLDVVIRYEIPSAAVNGDSASVVMRIEQNSGIMPEEDNKKYQSGFVRIDRVITNNQDMIELQNIIDKNINISGYYVLIPGELRTYTTFLVNCNDTDKFISEITNAFGNYGVQNVSIISCYDGNNLKSRKLIQTNNIIIPQTSSVVYIQSTYYPSSYSDVVMENGTILTVSNINCNDILQNLGNAGYDVYDIKCSSFQQSSLNNNDISNNSMNQNQTSSQTIENDNKTTIILAVTLSIVGTVVVALVIGIIIYKKRYQSIIPSKS